MRILICAQEAPLPPVNGFRLQVDALLGELRKEHDVRVLALQFPDQGGAHAPTDGLRLIPLARSTREARPVARTVSLLARTPFGCNEIAARLSASLEEEMRAFRPHVVHVAGTLLGRLGRQLSPCPTLIAPLDAAHVNAEARAMCASGIGRWYHRGEAARLRRFEARMYGQFRRVVVVSEADGATLRELRPSLPIVTIPNGVDAAKFAPKPEWPCNQNRVVFSGVMEAAPNITAALVLAREIMPLVRAKVPSSRLTIVGRAPVRAVSELAGAGTEVVGEVADMRSWLTANRVFACPMVSGTGIKNKLLEAMACGLACVATPRALRGLDVVAGREVLVADDLDRFASHVVSLLSNDGLAQRLGRAARAYVIARHDWRHVGEAYVGLYERMLAEESGYRSEIQLWSERPPSTGMRAPVT